MKRLNYFPPLAGSSDWHSYDRKNTFINKATQEARRNEIINDLVSLQSGDDSSDDTLLSQKERLSIFPVLLLSTVIHL